MYHWYVPRVATALYTINTKIADDDVSCDFDIPSNNLQVPEPCNDTNPEPEEINLIKACLHRFDFCMIQKYTHKITVYSSVLRLSSINTTSI